MATSAPTLKPTLDPRLQQNLRTGFKYLNRFMMLQWHLGLGKMLNAWPNTLGRYMVIVHTGRTSGQRRYTPLNYAEVDGEIYCTAGFGIISDWYKNVRAKPDIEVWLPDGWWCGIAEDISESPDKLRILRQVLIGSGFVAPLMGIDPKTMPEEQLQTEVADYRLVHIRRDVPCTGQGGPGKWSWVWPISAALLALFAIRPSRRH